MKEYKKACRLFQNHIIIFLCVRPCHTNFRFNKISIEYNPFAKIMLMFEDIFFKLTISYFILV